MKKLLMTIIVLMAAGQAACQQNWLDPNSIGFPVDPNIANYIVAVRIEADANEEFCYEQQVKPHIWPVTITYSGIPAGSRVEGAAWFWQPTLADIGPHYFFVTAKDDPPFWLESRSVTGVWVVQVVPSNPGPVLIPFVR